MKHSKRYIQAAQAVDRQKVYEVDEALQKVVETATSKFDESIEVHIKLGVDSKSADQQVRGVVVLPNGTGKSARVLVIAKGDNADIATKAGADFVGAEEIISKIQNQNWLDFDACITTPDMMGMVGRVAKVLGPRGLMPNPKSGTVTTDVAKAISDIKSGKVEYRLDKMGIIHVIIGKKSFGTSKLKENLVALMDAIIKAKPQSSKGQYLKSISIASSMGPGIKISYRQ